MKYIYIGLPIAIIAIIAYLFFNTAGGLVKSTAEIPPASVEKHFNAKDLAKLGCNVEHAAEKMINLNIPLVGTIEAYSLKSTDSCKIELLSSLSKISDGDAGTWAGVRASSNVKADRNSYTLTMYEGNVGEYSEIHIFEKSGQQVGFRYIVEQKGILHDISIFSDKIEPDEDFEIVLRGKIK